METSNTNLDRHAALQSHAKAVSAFDRWFGRKSVYVSVAGLVLALVTSPDGNGFQLCWCKGATGFDCIGCGLSRSLGCALRCEFEESFALHPFGPLILALFVVSIVVALLREHHRARFAAWMEAHARFFNWMFAASVVSFVGFGMVRFLNELFGALGSLR